MKAMFQGFYFAHSKPFWPQLVLQLIWQPIASTSDEEEYYTSYCDMGVLLMWAERSFGIINFS